MHYWWRTSKIRIPASGYWNALPSIRSSDGAIPCQDVRAQNHDLGSVVLSGVLAIYTPTSHGMDGWFIDQHASEPRLSPRRPVVTNRNHNGRRRRPSIELGGGHRISRRNHLQWLRGICRLHIPTQPGVLRPSQWRLSGIFDVKSFVQWCWEPSLVPGPLRHTRLLLA